MIDSHCHLTDPRLFSQLDAVLERAEAAGVTHMVTIGTDVADAQAAVALCERYADRVKCAIGIHPNHSHGAQLSDVDKIADLAASPHVIAIGEIGLDYHHKFAAPALQRKFFERQMDIAARLNKPAVLHCREAIADAFEVIGHYRNVRCVFHCFTGTAAEASMLLEADAWLGFTGAITFKKNDFLRDVVKGVPLDRLLIETDAPYLSPEPVRQQQTCEPAFIVHTLRVIAALHEVSVVEADRITADNTRRFYGFSFGG